MVNASGLSWNAGDMDFTGGQMVLTLKLISMAVCFQDTHSKSTEVRGRHSRHRRSSCVCLCVCNPPLHLGNVYAQARASVYVCSCTTLTSCLMCWLCPAGRQSQLSLSLSLSISLSRTHSHMLCCGNMRLTACLPA